MVDIAPFAGLLFNQEKTGPADQVTAPPYDVISPQQQDALYEKNPFNVVRLILEKQYPEDTEDNSRYTRSAATFQKWLEEQVLVEDEKPGFYVYIQDYTYNGQSVCRVGFFARVRTEDFSTGNICPHEFTLAKAKKDRMQLLKACRANFSPIFSLFSDPSGEIDSTLNRAMQGEPFAVVEENGILHKVWRLNDEETLSLITERFKDKKIFIADGHHRYETALSYHKENGDAVKDSAHVMMFLTNLDAQSLAIYPIHRLIKCPFPFDETYFMHQVENYFTVEPLPEGAGKTEIGNALESAEKDAIVFCIYLGKGRGYFIKLKDMEYMVPLLDPGESTDLKVLDVAQLHTLVIRTILKIDTRQAENQQYVTYKVDVEEALSRVDSDEVDLAFFMNATRIDQVRKLAENGIRLPQKATFFYPKLLSGLVINKFRS
ncbi:MAG: DUF1015 domain-containing protein [Nitrospinae bacterium]|nr:DUF1015 domain-containing protein [Nitrospinota bacterium]